MSGGAWTDMSARRFAYAGGMGGGGAEVLGEEGERVAAEKQQDAPE